MQIRRLPISKINRAGYNPRLIPQPGDSAYESLARGMDTFGLVTPLVWNSRTANLVSGHIRLAILISRGATHVDVSVVDLSPEQERVLNLALNNSAGSWDTAKLSALVTELVACPELDVSLTGFSMAEISDLVSGIRPDTDGQEEVFDLDDALDAQESLPAVTQPGDVIELGTNPETLHRLMCGSSTNAEHVRVLMNGHRASLCATDPPYQVSYTGENRPTKRARKKKSATAPPTWDFPEEQPNLFSDYIGVAYDEALLPNAAFLQWCASTTQSQVEAAWMKHNLLIHQPIFWVKPSAPPGRCWYNWRIEPALFGWKKGKKPQRLNKEALSNVWEVPPLGRGTSKRPAHPCAKPPLLWEIPLRQHTRPAPKGGEMSICYDPFCGSGPAFIAAHRLRRRCFGMEQDSHYCDLIVRRFIVYAGADAVSPEIAEKYRLPDRSQSALTTPGTEVLS